MKFKIISDGTNLGTKLVDEDSGNSVHGIGKMELSLNTENIIQNLSIDFFNIPVEIEVKAEVDLFALVEENNFSEPVLVSSFQKNVIIKTSLTEYKAVTVASTKILDKETNLPVSAIQSIKWIATADGPTAKIKKIRFDNKDWV